MSEYDNTGTTALWKNDKYEAGGKAPRLKGHFFAHRDIKAGDKVSVAYWDSSSENEKAPILKGKVEDPYVGDADQSVPMASAPATGSSLPSDEIPF